MCNLIGRVISASVTDMLGLAVTFYLFAALNLVGPAVVLVSLSRVDPMAGGGPMHSPVAAWVGHLRNPSLRASFAIVFIILFAFIGTFTYVNFVLCGRRWPPPPMTLGLVYLFFAPAMATTPLAGRTVERIGAPALPGAHGRNGRSAAPPRRFAAVGAGRDGPDRGRGVLRPGDRDRLYGPRRHDGSRRRKRNLSQLLLSSAGRLAWSRSAYPWRLRLHSRSSCGARRRRPIDTQAPPALHRATLRNRSARLLPRGSKLLEHERRDRIKIAALSAPTQDVSTMAPGSQSEDLRQAFARARDLDGSMGERLSAFADAVRRHSPAFARTVDQFVGRLQERSVGDSAPRPGEIMPPFVLPDENGRLVSLAELLERGPAVASFHRGHWCPYCRISINTLARAQSRMDALGAQMIAIVPEKAPFAAEMKFDSDVKFPILSDLDNGYALSLNLAIWIGGEMREMMAKLKQDLPRYQGNDCWMLPIPATFVVDRDGRIKARFIDPDFRRRAAVEDLIDSLK